MSRTPRSDPYPHLVTALIGLPARPTPEAVASGARAFDRSAPLPPWRRVSMRRSERTLVDTVFGPTRPLWC
jgi:hypothetical protein